MEAARAPFPCTLSSTGTLGFSLPLPHGPLSPSQRQTLYLCYRQMVYSDTQAIY